MELKVLMSKCLENGFNFQVERFTEMDNNPEPPNYYTITISNNKAIIEYNVSLFEDLNEVEDYQCYTVELNSKVYTSSLYIVNDVELLNIINLLNLDTTCEELNMVDFSAKNERF